MAATQASREDQRAKIQQLINKDEKGGWDKAWQTEVTPWDLGGVTPAVSAVLHSQEILPLSAKSVFVPGCGSGYDVIAFAEGGKRKAVGLDISETALSRARQLAEAAGSSASVEFVNEDFFSYTPSEPFDVIFDYTFFCALSPSLRPDWARKTASNLAPDGVLLTLVFPIGDYEGGPPYAVSKQAYEDVLSPLGLVPEELPTVSHPAREGKELLLKWTRKQQAKF